MEYSPECRYCIEHARKIQAEHKLEVEQLKQEIEALKTKIGCQEAFVDKLLLLIKPQKKGVPVMDGLKPATTCLPPSIDTNAKTSQMKFLTDEPYHR